jgi:hypothetical protein
MPLIPSSTPGKSSHSSFGFSPLLLRERSKKSFYTNLQMLRDILQDDQQVFLNYAKHKNLHNQYLHDKFPLVYQAI